MLKRAVLEIIMLSLRLENPDSPSPPYQVRGRL